MDLCMTLAKFRKLRLQDFEDHSVLVEIWKALKDREDMISREMKTSQRVRKAIDILEGDRYG